MFFGLCLAVALTACSRLGADTRVILTTGVHGDDVFRIGESVCTKQEMLVYLLGAGTGDLYKEDQSAVTDISAGDSEEEIKEYCLALVSQIKAMNMMAGAMDLRLDDTDREHAAAAGAAYMATLSPEVISVLGGITEKELEAFYLELALADKVYAYTIRDVNPEISDDEARSVTVELIFVSKSRPGGGGKERIEEAAGRVRNGEDFAMLTEMYNEEASNRISFGRGETGDIPEDAAFDLETGEVSDIIETDRGYYLLRSVSSFDREQTRANKEVILEARRKEAFAKEYNAFAKDLPVELNEKLWEELQVPEGIGAEEAGYWKYYAIFFGN